MSPPVNACNGNGTPLSGLCRGFGFVTVEAESDAALFKTVSVYNGTKWRGRVLMISPAKGEHYMDKLKREWALEKKGLLRKKKEREGRLGARRLLGRGGRRRRRRRRRRGEQQQP